MSIKETLSVSEVAKLLKVSKSTIYRRIRSDKLPAYKGKSGEYQIQLQDLVDNIQERHESFRREESLLRADSEEQSGENGSTNVSSDRTIISLTRRDFLKGTLSFVLGFFTAIAAEMIGSGGATIAYERFASEVKQKRESQEIQQKHGEMIERIFGRLYDSSWSANLAHFVDYYGEENLWRSNTIRASVALGSVLGIEKDNWLERAVLTDDFPGPVQIDGDIIAMGSPVSDPVARLNMEYVAQSRYEQIRVSDPLIYLPIAYDIGISLDINGSTPVRRFVAGKQRDKPNTTVRVENDLLPPPKLDRNGWLRSDYLLVTRMPNILNRNAFINGSEVLIVGGAHGVGTEAIDLLTSNINLLEQIMEQLGEASYYQILVPVIEIEHGILDGIRHSIPIKLGKPITRRMHVDVEKIVTRWSR
jgi:excisionase family DNA binding protein